MAILKELNKGNYRARRLTETKGEYSTSSYSDEKKYNNEKFFHIRTFGSDYREKENLGKVAQQIDLNKEMAKQLVDLLISEFKLPYLPA